MSTQPTDHRLQSEIDNENAAHPDSNKLKNLRHVQELMKQGKTSDFFK